MNSPNLSKPVDWDQLYPGRFLKAGELLGKQVTLTIKSVDLDELEGDKGKKVKGIISFDGTPKQLALNRTNGTCLREMFGRMLPAWVGKRVTLFPGEWNGEPCIRVWGSPDIERDMKIEVALPRRKPIAMVMHAVKRGNGQAGNRQQQQPQRDPGHARVDEPVPGAGTMDDGEPPDGNWEGRE